MTPEQIELVQKSFAKVPQPAAAQIFYARLFQLSPALRSLFRTDMNTQGERLMAIIAVAVNGLNDLETILPAVQDLGVRHVGYGVEREHYDVVGAALLWTLEKGLGDDFTEDVRRAWAAAYGLLSSAMIEAAEGKAA